MKRAAILISLISILFCRCIYASKIDTTKIMVLDTALVRALKESINSNKEVIKTNNDIINKLKKQKNIDLGLSIGYRNTFYVGSVENLTKFLSEASITTTDTTLHIDNKKRGSLMLSATISVYPFGGFAERWSKTGSLNKEIVEVKVKRNGKLKTKNKHKKNWLWLKDVGVIANVNLAEFADGESATIFNKKIEGGFGLSYRFTTSFSIGLTYEYVFNRVLRDYYYDNFINKKIVVGGKALTELNINDNKYFKDDNLNAFAIKLIYRIP